MRQSSRSKGAAEKAPMIVIRNESPLAFEGDGLVVPTASSGKMDSQVARRILSKVGPKIESTVISHAPIAVGACLLTKAPGLGVDFLVHAPVVSSPRSRIGVENIRLAVKSSLLGATRHKMESLCIPVLGYRGSDVSHEEIARAIIDEISSHRSPYPRKVVLLDEDRAMIEALVAQEKERQI